jgi:DnaD/phage-associated family protein
LTIYRVQKRDNYVVLDKGFLNDTELSWQAKGLLAYMLSLPNDWEFNMKDLQKRSKNGRDSTYRIMKELIEAGYVTRVENRDGGKFGKVDYIVHEVKQSPHPGNPDTGKPDTGNPYPGNQDVLLNNKELNNKLTKNNDDDNNKAQPKEKENGPNAFRFYEENFYPVLSSVDIEVLNYWLDRFPEEIVVCAMKKSLKQNVRNLAYVEKILINWEQHKVKSLEDIERLDRQHELQKMQKRGGVAYEPVYKHSGSDGGPSKENEPISHFEPGKWDHYDLSLEGLI